MKHEFSGIGAFGDQLKEIMDYEELKGCIEKSGDGRTGGCAADKFVSYSRRLIALR